MRRNLAALLFTTALLASAACGSNSGPSSSSGPTSPGQPAKVDKVTVGVIPILDELIRLAREDRTQRK